LTWLRSLDLARSYYRDLAVWQKSVELIKKVYGLAESLPKLEEYVLKQQLKRAVTSVALNIAEGKSRKSAKEFAQFLNISVASLAEVEAILLICEELGYLSALDSAYAEIESLGKMLNALRSRLYTKEQL
jgi:four helix bundle protein